MAEGEVYVSDWTVDLKTIIVYTEHRRSPGKPPEIQYSPQLKTKAVYLGTVGLAISMTCLTAQCYMWTKRPSRQVSALGKEGTLETAEKTTCLAYIRTYSNKTTTVLTANPNKTEDSVTTDNILTQFHGIAAQDHEAKFYHFGNKYVACGTHLTRELKGMLDLEMLPWAGDVRQFFLGMDRQKKEDPHSGKGSCEAVFFLSVIILF